MPNDAALWRAFAQVYDEVLRIIPYRNLLVELVERAQIEPGMTLLDACCGTGNLLLTLQQHPAHPTVTGLDYSETMMAKAAPKLAAYEGKAVLINANLDRPVATWNVAGPFDRFIFNNSLCLIKDPAEVLRKAATIAAPGAILVASTPKPNPNIQELLEEHLRLSERAGMAREDALQELLPRLSPLLKCNEDLLARYGDSYHLPSEAQLRSWFKDSGWNIEDLDFVYAGQNWLVVASRSPDPA